MESYLYIEHVGDTLAVHYIEEALGCIKPILWAQQGRYGWISKEQVRNMIRRRMDMVRQQEGYTKTKPIDLAFHWDDTTPLDPITIRLMRETFQ